MVILALAGCWSSGPVDLPAGDAQRPDIILVSIDTLRADHLSSHGYPRQTSPFLDRLAEQGTRFAHARSASPWTLPAHTTMLTGQLPATHRVVDDNLSLQPSVPVLPEILQGAGYNTAGFVSTLYVSRKFGFERGFDFFSDFGITTEKENLSGNVVAEDVVDAALEWLSKQPAEEPGFVFLHFYDVHYAYDPPAPYDTLFDRAPQRGDLNYRNYFYFKEHLPDDEQFAHQIAQYDESIRYVDDQLARLDERLRAAGREVRWVVTADHGEEFGERGSWGHAHTLYAEQLHVPLIVSGGGLPAGNVVEGWVGSHDIAPTIASWVDGAQSLRPDGIDLGRIMAGEAPPERVFLGETTRFKTNRLSILADGLRLEWDVKANRLELFDPLADPLEQNDLSEQQPAALRALQRRLVTELGEDWRVNRAVRVSVAENKDRNAFMMTSNGRRSSADLEPGDRFLVLPYDAEVRASSDGEQHGPWQAVGGLHPGDADSLTLLRTTETGSMTMSPEECAQLQALGYINDCGEP